MDFMDRNLLGKNLVYHELLYWTIRYGPLGAVIVGATVLFVYLGRRKLARPTK